MSSKSALKPRKERPSTRERRKVERLSGILAAAFEEFARRGYAAARLEDVADKVNLTKGSIYFYFKDKEQLFKEVVRGTVQPAIQQILGLAESFQGPAEELIKLVITTGYREMAKNRDRTRLVRLLISESRNFPELGEFYYREVLQHVIKMMEQVLSRATANHEFRQTRVAEFPQLIMAPVMMAVIWNLLFGRLRPIDLDRYLEAHLDLLMNGLKPRTTLSS